MGPWPLGGGAWSQAPNQPSDFGIGAGDDRRSKKKPRRKPTGKGKGKRGAGGKAKGKKGKRQARKKRK